MLSSGAFDGVRVVELAQYVFIPGAGAVLADFGAEVIHVEPVEGDPYRNIVLNDGRNIASINLAIEQNNRGKKSLAIDLKSPEGREILLKLIETADVFMTSIRPQALERLGLSVEALRERNPGLIYMRGNGMGFKGAEAERAGLDGSAFWARGGFAYLFTPENAEWLTRARGAMGDHAGSMNAAFGVAAALFHRERTGEPSVVETSLLSTAMWILSADIVAALNNPLYREETLNNRAHEFPLLRGYRTRDGRWIQLMMMESDRYWAPFCDLIGAPELANDPRFLTEALRREHGHDASVALRDVIAARDWADWKPLFEQLDGPWELAASIRELCEDPQAIANDYLVSAEADDGLVVRMVAGPVQLDGQSMVKLSRAPRGGEHNAQILAELGIGDAALGDLRARNIVA